MSEAERRSSWSHLSPLQKWWLLGGGGLLFCTSLFVHVPVAVPVAWLVAFSLSKCRWLQYGEPCGLLAKASSTATSWSVARRAVLYGITYPWFYAALIYFRDEPTPNWHLKLTGCILAFMAFGALAEWQRDVVPE